MLLLITQTSVFTLGESARLPGLTILMLTRGENSSVKQASSGTRTLSPPFKHPLSLPFFPVSTLLRLTLEGTDSGVVYAIIIITHYFFRN